MKLDLIMPMGGGGTRFGNHGFNVPKPLIEIYGKPFFYWATQSVHRFVDLRAVTFVVLREHIERFHIDEVIRRYYPDAEISVIPEVLPGAVMTCLHGIESIPEDAPVLFNDCDNLFLCGDFARFCAEERFDELDGALLTFASDDPRFSYAAFDEDGFVTRTVEKQVISRDAICGAYYFRNRRVFRDAAEKYMRNCSYSEFFMSGVYNVLAAEGGRIKAFRVDGHLSYGTPEEYEAAQSSVLYRELEDND